MSAVGIHLASAAAVGRASGRFDCERGGGQIVRSNGVRGAAVRPFRSVKSQWKSGSKPLRAVTTCGAGVHSPILKGAKKLALVVVTRGNEILLGRKKHGFGEGIYQGLGGRLLNHEEFSKGAVRVAWERVGVLCPDVEKKGLVWFLYDDGTKPKEIHVFLQKDPKDPGGVDAQGSEGPDYEPVWFNQHEIPYHQMWEGDKKWLPILLRDRCFKGVFCFEKDGAIDYARFSMIESDTLDMSFVETQNVDSHDKQLP